MREGGGQQERREREISAAKLQYYGSWEEIRR
jgi:hypothetical protein